MRYEITVDVDVSKMAAGDKIELTRLPKGAKLISAYDEKGKFKVVYDLVSEEIYPPLDGEMVKVEL